MSTDEGVRDRTAVAEAMERGDRVRFLFFWGHTPPPPGGVGPWCLSQWWPSVFEVDDVAYRTAEHYLMAAKARLFGDDEIAGAIVAAEHPRDAKLLGRVVRGFDEETWSEHRPAVAVRGNVAKFGSDPGLRDYLVGTGDRVLVEASPTDPVWGIGMAATDVRAERPAEWEGHNLLGFALMAARDHLRTGLPGGA
ncbi:NADAR family protein [Spongiactinospora sp. TRM90649]|uniref:NADAR family protein n=1 Tax=Spongiactinospora sp. TRM90649 TaxID=3031114 RepID=UPI0023F79754|nr:NADAR family protein [Spongiactinospora sp. TRM90649]MDF5757064.1 NADAR family protein [Spongiactinospora sp. TRM90649]